MTALRPDPRRVFGRRRRTGPLLTPTGVLQLLAAAAFAFFLAATFSGAHFQ